MPEARHHTFDHDTLVRYLRFMLRDPVYWREVAGLPRLRANQVSGSPVQRPAPPVTPAKMAAVKEERGLDLPPLLARMYLEVSDGGMAPVFRGLFALELLKRYEDEPRELWPGFRGHVAELGDGDEDIWIGPPDTLEVAHGGCQECYYIYTAHPHFPVLVTEEPAVMPPEPITFADDFEMLSYFGHVVARSFDAWIGEWVDRFTSEHRRDYADPSTVASLYPEPRYVTRRRGDAGYDLVTEEEWRNAR